MAPVCEICRRQLSLLSEDKYSWTWLCDRCGIYVIKMKSDKPPRIEVENLDRLGV